MFATTGLLWIAIMAGPQDGAEKAADAKPADAKKADVKVQALKIVETRVADFEKKPEEGFRFSFDRPGTKLTLQIKGPTAAGATHWGHLKLEAADDQKRAVKLSEDQPSFDDPREAFVQLDRDQMSLGMDEMPKDELRVEIGLESAARDAKSLNLRGRFQLKVTEGQDIILDGKPSDSPVKNEALEKAGLSVTIKPRADVESDMPGFVFEISGDMEKVLDAVLVDAAGEPIRNNGSQRMGSGEQMEYTLWFSADNPIPEDARLKVVVAAKEEVFEAEIDLKDVALP